MQHVAHHTCSMQHTKDVACSTSHLQRVALHTCSMQHPNIIQDFFFICISYSFPLEYQLNVSCLSEGYKNTYPSLFLYLSLEVWLNEHCASQESCQVFTLDLYLFTSILLLTVAILMSSFIWESFPTLSKPMLRRANCYNGRASKVICCRGHFALN